MPRVLPAHRTKHLPTLSYPFASSSFSLAQLDDGHSNGTALWLGAQCLSLYLHTKFKHSQKNQPRPRLVELGSGIGLTALAMSSLGWDVLATDMPHVISSVLTQNIESNLSQLPHGSGLIQIRQLDWTVPPDKWIWDDPLVIASGSSPVLPPDTTSLLNPPYDLIISADTVYMPSLIQPLLRTFHALSTLSISASSRAPPVFLCIERRDPALIDYLLSEAKTTWHFSVERIPHRKLVKAMEKGGVTWDKEDWDGIEIWKLTLSLQP